MSALTDAFDVLAQPVARECNPGKWLNSLEPAERAKIADYLAAGGSRSQAHQTLAGFGFVWSQSAFNNHLAGRCSCPRSESAAA